MNEDGGNPGMGDSGTPTGDGGAPSFATDVYPMLAACVTCHNTSANQGGLDLSGDAPTVFGRIVNGAVPTTGVALVCTSLPANVKLVVPGDSANSLVYNKVSMTTPICGSRMPLGGAPLAATDIATIKSWIDDGAKP